MNNAIIKPKIKRQSSSELRTPAVERVCIYKPSSKLKTGYLLPFDRQLMIYNLKNKDEERIAGVKYKKTNQKQDTGLNYKIAIIQQLTLNNQNRPIVDTIRYIGGKVSLLWMKHFDVSNYF